MAAREFGRTRCPSQFATLRLPSSDRTRIPLSAVRFATAGLFGIHWGAAGTVVLRISMLAQPFEEPATTSLSASVFLSERLARPAPQVDALLLGH